MGSLVVVAVGVARWGSGSGHVGEAAAAKTRSWSRSARICRPGDGTARRIRAATADGAELLRLPVVGTIEAGRRADRAGRQPRLAIAKDPLEDLDALAQGSELGGGETGERGPQGLDPSRPSSPQRAAPGRRGTDAHRPRVVGVVLAELLGLPIAFDVFHDELAHASIADGCRQAGCE